MGCGVSCCDAECEDIFDCCWNSMGNLDRCSLCEIGCFGFGLSCGICQCVLDVGAYCFDCCKCKCCTIWCCETCENCDKDRCGQEPAWKNDGLCYKNVFCLKGVGLYKKSNFDKNCC